MLILLTFVLFGLSPVICQSDRPSGNNSTSTPSSSSASVSISSTPSPSLQNDSCSSYGTCEKCLEHSECYFCKKGESGVCFMYTVKDLIPTDKCDVKSVNYWTCKVSFLVIVILIGIAIGLFVIILITCCCCCWCRSGRLRFSKDDLKWARQREERRARAEEKRKERAERTMEIRRKYGLLLDASASSGLFKDDTPYQRFDT